MQPTTLQLVATLCFLAALIHSLLAKPIENLATRHKERPALSTFLHFAGEIEIVFGLWAAAFIAFLIFQQGFVPSVEWLDQKNFSEPIFVFVIMVMASTEPILKLAEKLVNLVSKALPIGAVGANYIATLILGPLLGSLTTEPAAMTVSALLLQKSVFAGTNNQRLIYSTVACLFVNISIGGTLTHFAAPPVLMVARTWDWDMAFMFNHFGYKAIVAVVLNAVLAYLFNRKTLKQLNATAPKAASGKTYGWVQIVHVAFMVLAILSVHHPAFLVGVFLFFLGFTHATNFAQEKLKIEQSLLVAFFLSGLVILTGEQGWWLQPLLTSMKDLQLFVGASALTAITDNAALTSLAAQVDGLAYSSQYAVVAGAVVGGGLTLVANAPNPAGYAILRKHFEDGGINPGKLLIYAFLPTLIAGVIFWLL